MKKLRFTLFAAALALLLPVSCNKDEEMCTETPPIPGFSLGCELLPASEYAKIPLAEISDFQLKALPKTVMLPTPPVGDQGEEGSCVAWGTTYAGRSMDWQSMYGGDFTYQENIFSPEYVYNQIKMTNSCSSGAYVVSALNLLQSEGACTWMTMPYTDESCSQWPNEEQTAEAYLYRITGYERAQIAAAPLKRLLADNRPVIVAGPVNLDFAYLGNNQVLGKFNGKSLGGHCYCLVGYDDKKKAFKFQNSWGINWASRGYGWISYTFIASWWSEAYVVHTNGTN